jgi:hypothetical protein
LLYPNNDWSNVLTDYAVPAAEKTDTGSNDIFSQGWNFDDDVDEQIFCALTVPPDYDQSGSTTPLIWLSGWSVTDDICEFDPGTRTVVMGVSSRHYQNGDSASQAWSTEDTGTMSFACDSGACGGGLDCNRADVVKTTEVEVTPAVGDWSPNDFVLIRIRRKTASDDLAADFHLVTAMLKYEAGY